MDRCSYILTYTYKVDILNQGCRGRILKHSEIFDYAKANNCLLILQHIICAGESGRISGCSPSCVLPIICLQHSAKDFDIKLIIYPWLHTLPFSLSHFQVSLCKPILRKAAIFPMPRLPPHISLAGMRMVTKIMRAVTRRPIYVYKMGSAIGRQREHFS